jgi:hypothetical protein
MIIYGVANNKYEKNLMFEHHRLAKKKLGNKEDGSLNT